MERTYQKIKFIGISDTSFGEAALNALANGCQSVRRVD
jgi:flavin-binding protein dodecin